MPWHENQDCQLRSPAYFMHLMEGLSHGVMPRDKKCHQPRQVLLKFRADLTSPCRNGLHPLTGAASLANPSTVKVRHWGHPGLMAIDYSRYVIVPFCSCSLSFTSFFSSCNSHFIIFHVSLSIVLSSGFMCMFVICRFCGLPGPSGCPLQSEPMGIFWRRWELFGSRSDGEQPASLEIVGKQMTRWLWRKHPSHVPCAGSIQHRMAELMRSGGSKGWDWN